jgi:hypothetical protein
MIGVSDQALAGSPIEGMIAVRKRSQRAGSSIGMSAKVSVRPTVHSGLQGDARLLALVVEVEWILAPIAGVVCPPSGSPCIRTLQAICALPLIVISKIGATLSSCSVHRGRQA